MEYDLIVVSSGSIGAATSYYAAQAGLKVLVFDTTHPPHTQGSHHGKIRIIRMPIVKEKNMCLCSFVREYSGRKSCMIAAKNCSKNVGF